MKLIIAGGRNFKPDKSHSDILHAIFYENIVTEVISGGATGADAWGEQLAFDHGIPVKVFSAEWKTYGRAAGPLRNKEMAEYADAIVLLPGGSGTESMRKYAISNRLTFLYDALIN